MLSSHVQKVLKFAYIAPAAQEVAKVVENRKFTEEVNRFDPLRSLTDSTVAKASDGADDQ